MKHPKVLVACEESQVVCTAFREVGIEAYSCDLVEPSGGHHEWHIQGDAVDALRHCFVMTMDGQRHYIGGWDLVIAHPPCTYLSKASACRLYPRSGVIDNNRYKEGLKALAFFLDFYYGDAYAKCIAIENPVPLKVFNIPHKSQVIQPYMFGEPYSKKTYLWLKNLPQLQPTNLVDDYKPYVSSNTSKNKGVPEKQGVSRAGGAARIRSKTFPGIAKAMADQWGTYLLNLEEDTDA